MTSDDMTENDVKNELCLVEHEYLNLIPSLMLWEI